MGRIQLTRVRPTSGGQGSPGPSALRRGLAKLRATAAAANVTEWLERLPRCCLWLLLLSAAQFSLLSTCGALLIADCHTAHALYHAGTHEQEAAAVASTQLCGFSLLGGAFCA